MHGRVLRVALALGLALPAAGLLPRVAGHAGCALAAGNGRNSATLAIEHSNGAMIVVCVYFDTATVTGEDMLRASGVQFDTQSFGSSGDAVCQIDHEPATVPSNCFGSQMYW